MQCASNPDLWFSETPADIELAKSLCHLCPVAQFRRCRAAGWENEHGVYGGMSAQDRQAADPARWAALVGRNRADAEAHDTAVVMAVAAAAAGSASPDPRTRERAQRMTAADRRTLILSLLARGCTRAQVAAVTGLSVETIKSAGRRARRAAERVTIAPSV